MPNEMIEAARRALVRELPLAVCKACDDADLWDRCTRAVIASLREPSGAVYVAGLAFAQRPATDTWAAMIDHILTEEGETR